MELKSAVAILLCVGVAVGGALPALRNYETVEVGQVGAKVTNRSVPSLESDDLQYRNENEENLSRKKKSSTTTFCVEIKSGADQPPVIVCEPSGETNEKPPIPSSLSVNPSGVENYPQAIPDVVPAGYLPAPAQTNQPCSLDGSSAVPPQEIGILPPQTPPAFPQFFQFLPSFPVLPEIPSPAPPQPPQTLFGTDTTCPLASIISTLLQAISFSRLYEPKPYSSLTQLYPMGEARFWERNGYNQPANEIQFFSKPSAVELPSNVYSDNPFDLIYPKRGVLTLPRYNKPQISSVASIDKNQIPESLYNMPFLIQCNPTIIPLSPAVYAAAVEGAREAMSKPAYQVPVSGNPDIRSTQRAASYRNHLNLSPGLHMYQLQPEKMKAMVQLGTTPQQHPQQPTNKKIFPSASREGTANEMSGFRHDVQTLSRHQQAVPNSVATEIGDTVHQGANNMKTAPSQSVENKKFSLPHNLRHEDTSGGDGRAVMPNEQDKISPERSSVDRNPANGFESGKFPVFSQVRNDLVNRESDTEDQTYRRVMDFVQNRQDLQQEEQRQREPMQNVPGMTAQEYNYSQQPPTSEPFHSERLMSRMKSALAHGNTIQ